MLEAPLALLSRLAAAAGGPGWLAAAGVALALYWKRLPGVFHARVLANVLGHQLLGRKAASPLEPATHDELVLLDSMDHNLHCNNAIYAELGDHARIKLFMRMYGGLAAFRRTPIHNAGVTTLFLREFLFGDRMVVTARLVAYERRKWAWVALAYTHATTKRLHALGLTKMCWKEASGKTLSPQEALSRMGYAGMPPELRHGDGTSGGGGGGGGDPSYTDLLAQLQARLEDDCGFPAAPPATPPAGAEREREAAAAGGEQHAGRGGAGAAPRQRK